MHKERYGSFGVLSYSGQGNIESKVYSRKSQSSIGIWWTGTSE